MRQEIKKILQSNKLGSWLLEQKTYFQNMLPKKSYSQNGEDLILDFFLSGIKKGFYVDIGAYHPIHLSNTHFFYKKGWNGIQVEPNQNQVILFKKYRPKSITLQVGIGQNEGLNDFYLFKEPALSTFSKESSELHCSMGHELLEIQKIEIISLKKILEQYAPQKIHIMSIDVEGYDLEVLKTNDWDQFRPQYIVIETVEYNRYMLGKKLHDTFDPFMEPVGYRKVADTYINTIYQDKNIAHI